MLRATLGDVSVQRWIAVQRDNEAVTLVSCTASARKPGGSVVAVTAAIDGAAADGIVRLTFGTLDAPGKWEVEVVVNGEHLEEPIDFWVRPEYDRGPR